MKTVRFWLIFSQNTDVVKLNFLKCLDTIAMKILSPKILINEIFLKCFSLIWGHNLGAQTGIPVSKTLWIRHWSYVISNFVMKDIFVEQFIVLINPALF